MFHQNWIDLIRAGDMFYMQSVLIKLEKLKIDYVNLFAMQSNWEKFNEKRMSNQTIQKNTAIVEILSPGHRRSRNNEAINIYYCIEYWNLIIFRSSSVHLFEWVRIFLGLPFWLESLRYSLIEWINNYERKLNLATMWTYGNISILRSISNRFSIDFQ